MAASALSIALTLPITCNPSLPDIPIPFTCPIFRSRRQHRSPTAAIQRKSPRLWRISASTEDVSVPEAVVEKAKQVAVPASTNDDIGSTVVAALLAAAFVGLVVLTIGAIFIAVTDFQDKREREKFEKEEATNKKRGKKKVKVKASSGPRGFGQKVQEDDAED